MYFLCRKKYTFYTEQCVLIIFLFFSEKRDFGTYLRLRQSLNMTQKEEDKDHIKTKTCQKWDLNPREHSFIRS